MKFAGYFAAIVMAATVLLNGTAANAAGGKFALSYNEFKALSEPNRTLYVKGLVNGLTQIEAAQWKKGGKTSLLQKLPAWLIEQANAAVGDNCYYAGQIGSWVGGATGCRWPTGIVDTVCPRERGVQQKPCATVPYLERKDDASKPFCVMPRSNTTTTPAEECQSKMFAVWGDEGYEEIAKRIVENKNGEATKFTQIETVVNGRCPEGEPPRWCASQKNFVRAIRSEVSAETAVRATAEQSAARVKAEGELATARTEVTRLGGEVTAVTATRDELQTKVDTLSANAQELQKQADEQARINAPCQPTDFLERNRPIFCQMKNAGENKYYSLRYTDDTKTNLEMWTSDSPTGEWCRRAKDSNEPNAKFTKGGNRDGDRDSKNDPKNKGKKCHLKEFNIETKAITGGKLPASFKISQDAYNTNECRITGLNENRGEKKPETTDFVMGVVTTKEPYTRGTVNHGGGGGFKPENVASRILRDAEKSGRDAFRFRDQDIGCPDDATKNLAYALTALQAHGQCLVRDTQVMPQVELKTEAERLRAVASKREGEVNEDESDIEDYRVAIKTGPGAAGTKFRLKFRSYGDNKEGQKSVVITRPSLRTTAAEWLNGAAGDTDDAKFDGLLKAVENTAGTCRNNVSSEVLGRTGPDAGSR
ncbi:MAG: hypothetical protein ABL958_12485 [Bdellovibrionia bacterium]